MKQRIIFILTTCIWLGCNTSSDKHTTSVDDYASYLNNEQDPKVEKLQGELTFWTNKHQQAPNQWVYLVKAAGIQSALFDRTGEVEYLYQAEENLCNANNETHQQKASILRSLAKNYITQHKFQEAKNVLEQADSIGEGKLASTCMRFDVYMELGKYKMAEQALKQIDSNSFDFHIRLAKWHDHNGLLPNAIRSMERATHIAENQRDTALMLWSYSNLADFYGHAGRIEDSYQHYLKTLAIDAHYAYALRGVAWIVFSNERNCMEAEKIMTSVVAQRQSPDYYLFLAEIADYQNDLRKKEVYVSRYDSILASHTYGRMYNTYTIEKYVEEQTALEQAYMLAELEVSNRATAETYGLLALTQLELGKTQDALHTAEMHIINKTFEPKTLYILAEVHKANGNAKEAKLLKEELLEAIYELGPGMEDKIKAI